MPKAIRTGKAKKKTKKGKEISSKRLAALAGKALDHPEDITLKEIQMLAGSVLTQFEKIK